MQALANRMGFTVVALGIITCGTVYAIGEGVSPESLEIRVQDRSGPVPGATVRVGERILEADANGVAIISLEPGENADVAGWSDDHFIAHAGRHRAGETPVPIMLASLGDGDHRGYGWVPAAADPDRPGACQPCHSDEQELDLPFDSWTRSRHATAAVNPRFLDTYAGTNADGEQAPPRRFVNSQTYGRLPMLPAPGEPDFGPGFKLDWPDHAGNCATCHAPAAAVDTPYATDIRGLSVSGREGVGCDFCHKIWDVALDPDTGLPYPYRPGVQSFELRRPPKNHQFFSSGHRTPRRGGSFRAIQKRSAVCAPCHHAVFNGTSIYNSYGEWLESSYSEPDNGRSCQDCHMPSLGGRYLAAVSAGGQAYEPEQVRTHSLPGADDPELTRESIGLTLLGRRTADELVLTVEIANRTAGHHIPTGSPWRQLFLVVTAKDESGRELERLQGPVLPAWMGDEESGTDGYAGRSGRVFEKLLYSQWYGRSPAFDYWNPCLVETDTRIPANSADISRYRFAAPPEGAAVVEAVVIYRPVYRDLARAKGWKIADAVRARQTKRF